MEACAEAAHFGKCRFSSRSSKVCMLPVRCYRRPCFQAGAWGGQLGEQHRSTGAALLYREPAAPVTCHVSPACPPRRCRQDIAIIQTHSALLKACLFLIEKRLLCKTVLRHGGRVARNVCFPNGTCKCCSSLLSLLHSFTRRSRHVPARMAREWWFF